MEYPLAPQGVFHTVQGEGDLLGLPMVFVRFAGCPVGCSNCDTDYSFAERVTDLEILIRIKELTRWKETKWVWFTGGEPAVHNIAPLLRLVESKGYKTAVATSGVRDTWRLSPTFLSVSPHALDETWLQRAGQQVNVVPGLNGLSMEAIQKANDDGLFDGFESKWITPVWDAKIGQMNTGDCIQFVNRRPGWKLGVQAHKAWGVA